MSAPVVIGVDLGGTNVRAGLVVEGRLAGVRSVPVRGRGTEAEVLEDLFGAIDQVMPAGCGRHRRRRPVVIDLKPGVVYDVQNIPSWKEVPLRADPRRTVRLPVYVNNDANCFAAGEKHFGKLGPYDFAVGLIVGTGLGAGHHRTGGSTAGHQLRRG